MSNRPNLLLLFPDQWRWDWLGCEHSPYGKVPVRTPHLDALAARGTRFTQCRTNSPLCAPARACLATGQRYPACRVPDNQTRTPTEMPNLFRSLRDAGYQVATCGKSDLLKPDRTSNPTGYHPPLRDLGFTNAIDQRGKADAPEWASQGLADPYLQWLEERDEIDLYLSDFRRRQNYPGPGLEARPNILPHGSYIDDFCGRSVLGLLDAFDAERPWMLWANFTSPHGPHDPPQDQWDSYHGVAWPPPIKPDTSDATDPQATRRAYAAMCSVVDTWIGRIIKRLDSAGQLSNTLILFSSDHGDLLGDHGAYGKKSPLKGSVHVPLIAAGPGVARGEVNPFPVETIDLTATILAAAKAEPLPNSPGRVLSLDRPRQARRVQHSALGNWNMHCDGRYKVITKAPPGDAAPLAFDLKNDPAEKRRLRDSSVLPPELKTIYETALARVNLQHEEKY